MKKTAADKEKETTNAELEKNSELGTMRIWDQVSQTDIEHTKQVEFGRKFTAIDAHSQIMEATRIFGPVGQGWGYENAYGEMHLQDGRIVAWCDVTFWWHNAGEWEGNKTPGMYNRFGPVRGAAMLHKGDSKKLPDTDAYKKASTDGLTKLLSHLGFNADVFLGMFDDNKYVEGLKKEKEEEKSASDRAYEEDRSKFIREIKACKTAEDVDNIFANHKLWMKQQDQGTQVEMKSWVERFKTTLEGTDSGSA